MTIWICATCGVEHSDTEAPPDGVCAIYADERQCVPRAGQSWTSLGKLATDGHELLPEQPEPGLHRLGRDPGVGIDHWSYLAQTSQGNLLWDPPNYLDDPIVDTITELGGIAAIAASHPHMYGSQVSWSHRFGDVPVLVNASDRQWLRREDRTIRNWQDTEEIPQPHPTVPRLVRRIADRVQPYAFDRLYDLGGERCQAMPTPPSAVPRNATSPGSVAAVTTSADVDST